MSDKVALGAGITTGSPEMVEAIGRSDLDYVWLDLQHQNFSPYDSDRLGNLVRAAESSGTSLLVRVPLLERSVIGKVLDSGVCNVLVPEVETQEQVSHALSYKRFRNRIGFDHRSVPLSRGTDWKYPDEAMIREIDNSTTLGIMIEHRSLIDGLGSTISLEGVNFAFLGFNDLSLSLGLELGARSEVLDSYAEKALMYCKNAKIPLGRTVYGLDTATQAIKKGYRLLTLGFDALVLQQYFDNLARELRSLS